MSEITKGIIILALLFKKGFISLYLEATTGYSNEQIGVWMYAHRNSISQWVQLYKQGGLQRIVQIHYGTNKSESDA